MAFVSYSIEGHCQAIDYTYNGREGTWFPIELSKKVLADIEELRLIKPKIKLLEDRIQLKSEAIASLRIAIESSKEAEKRSSEQVKILYGERQRLEDELNKVRGQKYPVWKHPAVWFSIGVIVSVGVLIGAVQVLDITH